MYQTLDIFLTFIGLPMSLNYENVTHFSKTLPKLESILPPDQGLTVDTRITEEGPTTPNLPVKNSAISQNTLTRMSSNAKAKIQEIKTLNESVPIIDKPENLNDLGLKYREEQLNNLVNYNSRSLRRIYSNIPETHLQFDDRILAIEEDK